MIEAAITHRQTREFIYPDSRYSLVVRLTAARKDLRECKLFYWKRSEPYPDSVNTADMNIIYRDGIHDYFHVRIETENPTHYIKYYFKITDYQGNTRYLNAYGILEKPPVSGFFEYLYTNDLDVFTVPEWSKGIVYYQIFPERFAVGIKNKNWHTYEPWYNTPTRVNYFGGDLKGIIQQLDYLEDLGIHCIYLTPIFKGEFNHKYATTDYYAVDPDFGTDEDLCTLVEECHKRGIRILLDGVFNHVGRSFGPFADLIKNGEESQYKDWFYIHSFPVTEPSLNYECVGDYCYMPKLRTSNPQVREMILDVMQYWIDKANIDGWRLDVADELEMSTWQYIRMNLKQRYPEILLLGETWGDAFRLVGNGDQLDTAMNYLFRDALVDFFAKGTIGASGFDHRINNMLSKYSDSVNKAMYNLLDSHDTARFLHETKEDKKKLQLAVAFQMTFIGSPAIFYGDEVGISGDKDPDCRKCMVWDKQMQDQNLLNEFKKFIGLRRREPALQQGSYTTILCDDGRNLFGFVRKLKGESIYVVFNNGPTDANVAVPVCENAVVFRDVFSETFYTAALISHVEEYYNSDFTDYTGTITLSLPAYSVKIIKSNGGEEND